MLNAAGELKAKINQIRIRLGDPEEVEQIDAEALKADIMSRLSQRMEDPRFKRYVRGFWMSITQLKKEIKGLKEALTHEKTHEETVIIYDPEKGIPEVADSKMRIFIPDNGRDPGVTHVQVH